MGVSYGMLLQSSVTFVRMVSIVALLMGIGMLIGPGMAERIRRLLSRHIGLGGIVQKLDRPRWIERYFYVHHRIAGAVLLAGAVVGLHAFIFSPKVQAAVRFLPRQLWWMGDAALIIMAAGSVLAVLTSLAMLVRPDLLHKIEEPANRWISTDRFFSAFDANRLFPARSKSRYRKVVGLLLIAACIYNLILLRHIP